MIKLICAECGKVFFANHKNTKMCSDVCRVRRKQKRDSVKYDSQRKGDVGVPRICKVCGEEFVSYHNRQICSEVCRKRKMREDYKEHHDARLKQQADYRKKRAEAKEREFLKRQEIKNNRKVKELYQLTGDELIHYGDTQSKGYPVRVEIPQGLKSMKERMKNG